ncbi:MAG: purine-nucleoside phosphorylase [Bacteroides sp.]|nr:purine-nucleoside phosphorylase [Prevotella sp.]MCM1408316.1 purine-nucleoside phosphorylase [Treponema brennaborense]MCM1470452.1 purine-nucleoside phosphorylase [Bacteroides sp.]
MSIHIAAKSGDIAETVLLPGDPLRAKYIAESFLENPVMYTEIRNMFGFTGTYKGKKVSVQGTGMGMPSLSIYVNELFSEYDVRRAIRIGTCGAIHPSTKIRDIILASSACSDSACQNQRFGALHFAPTADFGLLSAAKMQAEALNVRHIVGSVASTDMFYDENENWRLWAQFGVLGMEMETAELYTLAAKYGRPALAILTVSDHMVTGEATSAEERRKTFNAMIEIALETAVQQGAD